MKSAEQYRAAAADCRQREADSFERSDTDGFMSQWASNVMAQVNEIKAEIVENGNMGIFRGLYDGNRRVMAKVIDTKFGASWLLSDEESSKYGRKFLPIGSNSRVQKQLGLRERMEKAPAWVTTAGNSIASVSPVIFRTGDKWGSDAVLCKD